MGKPEEKIGFATLVCARERTAKEVIHKIALLKSQRLTARILSGQPLYKKRAKTAAVGKRNFQAMIPIIRFTFSFMLNPVRLYI